MSDCREAGRLATGPWSLPVAGPRPGGLRLVRRTRMTQCPGRRPPARRGRLSPGRARIGSHLGRGTVNLKVMAVGLSDPGRHHVTVQTESA